MRRMAQDEQGVRNRRNVMPLAFGAKSPETAQLPGRVSAPEPERLAKFRSAKVNGNAIDFRQWKEAAMAGKFDCFVIVQASGD